MKLPRPSHRLRRPFTASLAPLRALAHPRVSKRDGARVGLFLFGVSAGVATMTAALVLAGSLTPMFGRAEELLAAQPGLTIEAVDGAIPWKSLGTLERATSGGKLHPLVEAAGTIGDTPVRIVGVDLLSDPVATDTSRALGAACVCEVTTPVVLCGERLRRELGAGPGSAHRLTIDETEAWFVEGDRTLPDELAAGHREPTVAIDVAQLERAFGPVGTRSLRVSVAESADAAAVVRGLAEAMPAGAYVHVSNERTATARGFVLLWKAVTAIVVAIASFTGLLLVGLTATTTLARLKVRAESRGVAGSRTILLVDLAEVAALGALAHALGLVAGSLLARWILVHGTPGPSVPLPGPDASRGWPILASGVATIAGVGVPMLWAALVRLTRLEEPARRFEVAPAPLALGSVLLVGASAFFLPLGWPASPFLPCATAFTILVALALVVRPMLFAITGGVRRFAGERLRVSAWVAATYVRESTTPLLLALAVLTFGVAGLSAAWVVSSALERENAAWVPARYANDLEAEAAVRGEGLSEEVLRALRAAPAVASVRTAARVSATVRGHIVELDAIPEARINELPRLRRARDPRWGRNDAVPIFVSEREMRRLGVELGDFVRIDAASGSWPGMIEAVYMPHVGEPGSIFVPSENALPRLNGGAAPNVACVDLASIEARREAIARALVAGGGPLVWRTPGAERPLVEETAHTLGAGLRMLVQVLLFSTAAVAASAGAAVASDAPSSWPVLAALGVTPRRLWASATAVTTAFLGGAIAVGGAVGFVAGSSILSGIAGPAADASAGGAAIILLAAAIVWSIASIAGGVALHGLAPWGFRWAASR